MAERNLEKIPKLSSVIAKAKKVSFHNEITIPTDLFDYNHIEFVKEGISDLAMKLDDKNISIEYSAQKDAILVETKLSIGPYITKAKQLVSKIGGNPTHVKASKYFNYSLNFDEIDKAGITFTGVLAYIDGGRNILHGYRLKGVDTDKYTVNINSKMSKLIVSSPEKNNNYVYNYRYGKSIVLVTYCIRGWINKTADESSSQPVLELDVHFVDSLNGKIVDKKSTVFKTVFPTIAINNVLGGGIRPEILDNLHEDLNKIIEIMVDIYDGTIDKCRFISKKDGYRPFKAAFDKVVGDKKENKPQKVEEPQDEENVPVPEDEPEPDSEDDDVIEEDGEEESAATEDDDSGEIAE